MIKSVLLYIMAIFYFLGGVAHFRNREFYRPMMPPYLPAHDLLIDLSGIAEIILGLALLFPQTRALAAWGVIALLVAVFPANVQMLLHAINEGGKTIPIWALWVRLPIQGLLIYWAYWYTKS